MSEAAVARMAVETFLDWQSRQEWRWELIDGRPVAMTGATFAHEVVVDNIRSSLTRSLRAANNQCRTLGADIGVVIDRWTLRRPDVAVYCPPWDDTVKSDRPRLVAEVLSRSTEQIDYFIKLEEYKSVSALRTILLVDPRFVAIGIWSRDTAGDWQHHSIRDIGAVIDIPDLGITLAVQDVYEQAAIDAG